MGQYHGVVQPDYRPRRDDHLVEPLLAGLGERGDAARPGPLARLALLAALAATAAGLWWLWS